MVLYVGSSDELLHCLDQVDLSELMESSPEEELPLPVALATEPPVWFDLVQRKAVLVLLGGNLQVSVLLMEEDLLVLVSLVEDDVVLVALL